MQSPCRSRPGLSALLQNHFPDPIFGMRVSDWLQRSSLLSLLHSLRCPSGHGWQRFLPVSQTSSRRSLTWFEQKVLTLCGVAVGRGDGLEAVCRCRHGLYCPLHWCCFCHPAPVQQFLPLNPSGLGACPGTSRLTPRSVLQPTPTGRPICRKSRSVTSRRWSGLPSRISSRQQLALAVLIALILAFSRRSGTTIGNFWVLLVRSVMILMPICLVIALVLVSQGSPRHLAARSRCRSSIR